MLFRKSKRSSSSLSRVLMVRLPITLLLFLAIPKVSTAREEATEVVSRFISAILEGNESAVMDLIHSAFNAEVGDKSEFNLWLRKWFGWDDDYIFEPSSLSVKTEGDTIKVSGSFTRAWLMGIHADDVDISAETELTEGLEEEGASVQKVEKTETITFTLKKEDAGKIKIIGIEGMSMYDPQAAAVGSRDPRAKKIGQALSSLTKIPLIGGIFSPNKMEFEKGKRGLIFLVVVVGGMMTLWIGVGVAKTQLQLAVLNAHSFPEGVSYHTQFQNYIEHRARLESGSTEKRHDFYLRRLIDEGKFDEAKAYTEGMVVFAKRKRDKKAVETYQSYRKRVETLHEDYLSSKKSDDVALIHKDKTDLDVHHILGVTKEHKENGE